MKDLKDKLCHLYNEIDKKFEEQFSFRMKETTFAKIVRYLHEPKDSSSLAVTRILFGLSMLLDIPDERGGTRMNYLWGNPKTCHSPLIPFIQAVALPYMALVYAALWIGALGIMLGYKYRCSALMFTICYWYLFLIEKSQWNNHSYLFGLVGFLLTFCEANCYWSLDAYLNPKTRKTTVPYWNYFLLKYQFFIMYFIAGLKKGTAEWLDGYSLMNLSMHWVFDPFKLFLTEPQIDYLIIHWFAFIFDLTVAIWMMWSKTRHVAMIFCASFHLMNSRLFRIGMFPWVCLATMPLFYPFDWPKRILAFVCKQYHQRKSEISNRLRAMMYPHQCECKEHHYKTNEDDDYKMDDETDDYEYKIVRNYEERIDNGAKNVDNDNIDNVALIKNGHMYATNQSEKKTVENKHDDLKGEDSDAGLDINEKSESGNDVGPRKKLTTVLIMFYVFTQAFLPYSHFITKGYNNWTNGLYGYSWDMMVHSWQAHGVIVKLVDNESRQEFYIDPSMYTVNDRWSRHSDMLYQYAHCLKNNILEIRKHNPRPMISENFSIYIDVWCSMNERFGQRMFNYKMDLLQASWSPFENAEYLMPILDEALHWRATLTEIRDEVRSWNNITDVIFLADMPNYEQQRFITEEISNVTLTVLNGTVAYQPEVSQRSIGQSYKLTSGDHIKVASKAFHSVLNIGDTPAYYMYTFANETEEIITAKPKLPIVNDLYRRFLDTLIFGSLIWDNVSGICFLGCSY